MSWFDGFWGIPIDLTGQKNRRKLAQMKNAIAFQREFMRFCEDGMDRYEIEGLPKTISKRVVLQSLFWHANVVFFEKQGNLFALPGAPSGDLNVYGDPAVAEVYSLNGMFNEPVKLYLPGSDEGSFLSKTDYNNYGKARGVMVWENKKRYPFVNYAIYYAMQISDSFRALEVVRQNIKTPLLFFCEETVANSVKKYLEERDDNIEALAMVSTGVFEANKVSTVPLDTKGSSLSDITALIEWYESKYRELCGVRNNAQMDKKGENLIEAEVSVNDEYTESNPDKCIEVMNECFEDVNRLFGTSIRVARKERDNENIQRDDTGKQGGISGDGGRGNKAADL